jgi:putative DNA primase/helicase
MNYTPQQALDALNSIPNNLSGDDWLRPSIAAKVAGIIFADWHTWCQGASNYINEADCRNRWKSFDAAGQIQPGTLFFFAREHGWRPDIAQTARKPQKPLKPVPEKEVKPNPSSAVWERLEPVTTHPYAVKKKLSPDTLALLRVVPENDPFTKYRGWLAVPGYSIDGNIQTIEFISQTGEKSTLKDSHKSGAFFTVGPADGDIFVTEGIGAASAAYQSTGSRATGCFGSGNVRNVVEALRTREPDTKISICPDRGKESEGQKIADEFGCGLVTVPECEANNFDINDLFCRDGYDSVQSLFESATEPTAPSAPTSLLKDVCVFDLFTKPPTAPCFVWDGYLPKGVVSLLGAHGGTGKSTIALMLAVCTALGRPLFGTTTQQCNVVFYSAEDGANVIRHRLASICRAWLIDPEQLRGRLRIVDATEYPELFLAEGNESGEITQSYIELKEIIQTYGAGLVIIDNASDAYGADEIKRRQVRAFIRSLGSIAKTSDCALLMLMHVDKATSRNKKAEGGEGYSGSTAWHNSARSRLFLTRGDDGLLTLEHQKSNFGKMREPITLNWADGGFPQLVDDGHIGGAMQGRADDDRAILLLKLIAEFESRGQYCSPAVQARNNVHAMLRSEPTFLSIKLRPDDTKRIVNQCQRAKWLDTLDYKSANTRKHCQRWAVTNEGRAFAGLPLAPTAPTAPTCHVVDVYDEGAICGAPTAPTSLGGVGDRARTDVSAKTSERVIK